MIFKRFKTPFKLYHYHIRKTGGTSINYALLSITSMINDELYKNIVKAKEHIFIADGLTFVGWNIKKINTGRFTYAFSHAPFHKLSVPKDVKSITCFRDPCKRVLSHFDMLSEYKENNINHPCMELEGPWIEGGFSGFLDNLPRKHLLNQIFMFSKQLNTEEAYDNIMGINYVFLTSTLAEGLKKVSADFGLQLEIDHKRRTSKKYVPTEQEMAKLRELLESEYNLLDKLHKSNKFIKALQS